ncbi:para-aminobenzoate synthetase component 1 [Parafilimonas terrae]|uniref:Para-aminobenzoate synthetase component 1 n=2 Tax=Parafilimonas terrae TaxID=1465490 RepID=A0A1I5RZJ2_9BACT|nr:para-aminobenzoate synthetase component 1 [Parafilimonas terrae]
MLSWANRFGICCFMDSHHYVDEHHKYDCLVAVDAIKIFSPSENILSQLDNFYNENKDWIFGHLGYDLKNEIEGLLSLHINKIGFEDVFFFVPSIVISLNKNIATIHSANRQPRLIFEEIKKEVLGNNQSSSSKQIELQSSLKREEYLDIIKTVQQHILRGDCYELNYCQEFFAEDVFIEPLLTYSKLIEISPTPFSCFYKIENKYLLCASPERFLSKYKSTVFSQPIKGTAPRNANNALDEIEKENLQANKKERSENVMIVDLVRNDLSKICKEGTVMADELFGIYSFPQVHQMISTIKGELRQDVTFAEIIRATFPMGSMTGAPKRRAMQLIEQYEKTKRQLFSGSVGYISPERDFDFNVVIRSIFYNADNRFLNYLVGGAITFYADAEKEYEECLLKAKAIIDALR